MRLKKREAQNLFYRFHVSRFISLGGSAWESNPPRLATRPVTDVEDREAHRDLTTPKRRILEGGKGCKGSGVTRGAKGQRGKGAKGQRGKGTKVTKVTKGQRTKVQKDKGGKGGEMAYIL